MELPPLKKRIVYLIDTYVAVIRGTGYSWMSSYFFFVKNNLLK